MIRVYADWQPGYMGERARIEQEDFKTMIEAELTINKWRKTAHTIKVSVVEETLIAKYVLGKKVKP